VWYTSVLFALVDKVAKPKQQKGEPINNDIEEQ